MHLRNERLSSLLYVGWLDGMVVIGHRYSRSTFGAKNDDNDGDYMNNINSIENNKDISSASKTSS